MIYFEFPLLPRSSNHELLLSSFSRVPTLINLLFLTISLTNTSTDPTPISSISGTSASKSLSIAFRNSTATKAYNPYATTGFLPSTSSGFIISQSRNILSARIQIPTRWQQSCQQRRAEAPSLAPCLPRACSTCSHGTAVTDAQTAGLETSILHIVILRSNPNISRFNKSCMLAMCGYTAIRK